MVQIPRDQIKSREILNWKGLHLFHFRTSSCSQKLRIYLNLKKFHGHLTALILLQEKTIQNSF